MRDIAIPTTMTWSKNVLRTLQLPKLFNLFSS